MGTDSQREQLQEIWVAGLEVSEMYKRLKVYFLQFYKEAVNGQALFQDFFCCYLSGQLLFMFKFFYAFLRSVNLPMPQQYAVTLTRSLCIKV